jgi:hypothetical protein
MTRILQGELGPCDFPEGYNAIDDHVVEVLRRYFE